MAKQRRVSLGFLCFGELAKNLWCQRAPVDIREDNEQNTILRESATYVGM